ncbi:glutamate decarboxylase [Vibrio aquimaris]|uniref:Glutamate decarboxylase n=1 Tax=Vibrio aquimaris TaxID=2587862 RepID=A0A5P9CIS7_9VIBR|nr:glutamate decarboxylase [Vibrio aquimaris]QFT26134.1 Glutamate decarboxylase beta [Vibrio aquimaris]
MGNINDIELQTASTPTYGRNLFREEVPTDKMPDIEHDPQAVYRFIRDELQLDGNPTLNMASFVTTVMDEEANQLIRDNLGKNYIDGEVYNRTLEIEQRCVRMLLDLFNAPHNMKTAQELADDKHIESGWGTVAIGSSEALMLCALSHKEQWKKKRKAQGKSFDKPNIVIGSDVHITWVKYAQYFDVDIKWIPISEENNFVISANQVREVVDENTTCVVAVMGTSYTGQNDPVEAINDVLVDIKNDSQKGWDVPLHVDGASGGFIEPFRDDNQVHRLNWDFKLEQVKTINVSGHKFGLVYPGVGWALWKNFHEIPDKLFITTNVLGFDESTYSLNFSRGSAMVLAQYYNFLRLGKRGYGSVVQNLMSLAQDLSNGLGSLRLTVTEHDKNAHGDAAKRVVFKDKPIFSVINNADYFPASVVRLNLRYDGQDKPLTNDDIENYLYSVHDISDKLKQSNWVVPAFTMPLEKTPPIKDKNDNVIKPANHDVPAIAVMRMVVKEGISRDMVSILIQNYADAVIKLEEQVRGIQNADKTYKASISFEEEVACSATDLVEVACLKLKHIQKNPAKTSRVALGAK